MDEDFSSYNMDKSAGMEQKLVLENASNTEDSGLDEKLTGKNQLFTWTTYLGKPDFLAAPVSCFKHAPCSTLFSKFPATFRIELAYKSPESMERYWVATVKEMAGYMALLHLEGAESGEGDFWINICTAEVHEVGWCSSLDIWMIPPEGISESSTKSGKHFTKDCDSLFIEDFPLKVKKSLQSQFSVGMRLEVVDKSCMPSITWATVSKVIGHRLCLKSNSSTDEEDFWCHELSPLIHPLGWVTILNHPMCADKIRNFFEKDENPDVASWDMFPHEYDYPPHIEYEAGMKLEVINPYNWSSICVATVKQVMHLNYLIIGLDFMKGKEDSSKWFCYHGSSPYICPVGFCEANAIKLTPPRGYNRQFKWKYYLKQCNAKAVSFKEKVPNHGFQEGMHLEAVDLVKPHLICVASVSRVVGRLLLIHFDGWDEKFDRWYDCESPDLFPIGWCEMVGYKLEPPLPLPDDHEKLTMRKKRKISNDCQTFQKSFSTRADTSNQVLTSIRNEKDPNNQGLTLSKVGGINDRKLTLSRSGRYRGGCTSNQCLTLCKGGKNRNGNTKNQGLISITDNKTTIKQDLLSITDDSRTTIKQDLISITDDRTTVKQDSISITDDRTAVKQDSIPITDDRTAVKQDSIPITDDRTTIKQDSIPITDDRTTIKQDLISITDDRSTVKQDSISITDDRTAVKQDSIPITDDRPTVKQDSISITNDRTIIKQDSISTADDMPTVKQDTISTADNSSYQNLTPPSTSSATSSDISMPLRIGSIVKVEIGYSLAENPREWSVWDVCHYLESRQLGAYTKIFKDKEIDGPKFLQLTKEQLLTFQGLRLGPVLKLAHFIQRLKYAPMFESDQWLKDL